MIKKIMKSYIGVLNLGLVNFAKSLDIQKNLLDAVKHRRTPWNGGLLLILEHFPVYTIGIRTKSYSDQDEKILRSLGADFHKINRGGLITFHGPGQLVAYPIIDLKCWKPSVRWYINNLEDTVIDLCSKLNVQAHRFKPHPGIWVGENKICAIGVHVSRYITTHGIALNCTTDLSWFDHITPCGIKGKGVTSLTKYLNKTTTVANVSPLFLESFNKYFPCEMIIIENGDFKEFLSQT